MSRLDRGSTTRLVSFEWFLITLLWQELQNSRIVWVVSDGSETVFTGY